ncbi:MAG: type II CRISPR-associated endonuclease Cas1 [Clostridia bacterium]|nr:type II CRISPR-associated endonuclease Cas1 [Clostridia bacterium]
MAYINIYIANPCKISVKDSQLVLDGDRQMSFPVEDINSVMIESRQIMLTAYTLTALTDSGAVVYICDGCHLPHTLILPCNTHSRQRKQLMLQLALPKPVTKQLWQTIIKQKIINQAKCLELCGKRYNTVLDYAGKVLSGDSTNQESAAAREYFRILFGEDFKRQEDNALNGALNYGYAIVRGIIARSIVAHGFEPSFGIWHCSELNNFNLADDIIEPFRPLVDMLIYEGVNPDITKLTTEIKKTIYNVVNCDVLIKGERHSVSNAVDIAVEGYLNSCENKSCCIALPELVNIAMHEYE